MSDYMRDQASLIRLLDPITTTVASHFPVSCFASAHVLLKAVGM